MLRLDERIAALAALTPPCELAADIGCDHGRLGAHLLLTGKARRVQFSDISEASIAKARALIQRLNLSDRAVFRVGDGAKAVLEPPDVAIIAGMGAETIRGIVLGGRAAFRRARLVMQPNLDEPDLRACLVESGYRIEEERVVRAAGRWYVLIAARAGEMRLGEFERLTGTESMRADWQAFEGYARFRVRVAEKALAGAALADAARAERLRWEIAAWERALK